MEDPSLVFLLNMYAHEKKAHPDISKNFQILHPADIFIELNLNQQANFKALQEREQEEEMQEIMQDTSLNWWGLFADGQYHSSYYTPNLLYGLGINMVKQGKTVLLAKYGCQECVEPPKVIPHYN